MFREAVNRPSRRLDMRSRDGVELLRARHVAEMLDVSPRRVLQLARERRIPAVRTGPRAIRFPKAAVEAWLASRVEKALAGLVEQVDSTT